MTIPFFQDVLTTATAAPIGPTGQSLEGLAFSPGGSLFGTDYLGNLYSVSKTSGATTFIGMTGLGDVEGLEHCRLREIEHLDEHILRKLRPEDGCCRQHREHLVAEGVHAAPDDLPETRRHAFGHDDRGPAVRTRRRAGHDRVAARIQQLSHAEARCAVSADEERATRRDECDFQRAWAGLSDVLR